jgi:glutamate/tyrosine decarboxylase-like PLP-dependent enzyme
LRLRAIADHAVCVAASAQRIEEATDAMNDESLDLDAPKRAELWRQLVALIEDYRAEILTHPVAPKVSVDAIRNQLAEYDFTRPLDPIAAVDFVAEQLWRGQVHTPHPRYFGLFNPAATDMGIAADAIVAAFNPQLASWSHSPFAVEVERHLVRAFGLRFGFEPDHLDGTFASGGAEANHTALLSALASQFPEFARQGVRAIRGQPTLYISCEGHHSFLKAARLCGLGTDAVREIPVDNQWRMDVTALADQIADDRRNGFAPCFVVATAGTTSAGTIDPIPQIAELAETERLWLHVDAAWGGAAVLVPELHPLLDGCERADSITFDAHKWLSVPMGAGLYLTRHADILDRTFRTETAYMPREQGVVHPYAHSMQWSRRFTGLKVFLSLAVAGWDGYVAAIRHQSEMGEQLRGALRASGWEVVNSTPLPLACFVDLRHRDGRSEGYLDTICDMVVASGRAWISRTRLAGTTPTLRACITNHRTRLEDVRALVDTLNDARAHVQR